MAVEVIAACFKDDPTIKFLLSSMPEDKRLAFFPTYWRSLLRQAMLNDAIFQEANDWACCAVWMLPGKRIDNPLTIITSPLTFVNLLWNVGVGSCKRMLSDYPNQTGACKQKGLRDRSGRVITRYHYLFITGTLPAHRGKGLVSGLIAQYQKKAANDGLPIWLEATTPKSRDIYSRLGFEIVGEVRLGKGTHAESGDKVDGGPGVPLWGMIWRPSHRTTDKEDMSRT